MVIKINVTNKRAALVGSPVIVCGNSGYTLEFTFDAEWSAESVRTARFVYVRDGSVQYQDVVFSGTTAQVPVLANIKEVRVGVFAGDLHTSTPALIPCERSIRCGTGAPEDPTPSQYDQIMALLSAGVVPHAAQHRAGGSDPLTAADVGARPNTWMPTAADVGAVKNTGDTMKGALNVAANNSQTPFVITNTAAGTANIGTSAGGKYKYLAWLSTQNNTDDLYLSSNCTGEHHERKLLHTGNIFDHAVNKADGRMTGNLSINKASIPLVSLKAANGGETVLAKNASDVVEGGTYIDDIMPDGTKISLKLMAVNSFEKALQIRKGETYADVFHAGNKPSGSYTGNGEATARTIETGGIGNCCVVYGGTDHVAYLTPKGAFFQSGGVMAFTSDVSFSNGVISLRNAYIINTANITYNYQVL